MSPFLIVTVREVVERVRSKAFLVSTAFTLLLVGGVVVLVSVVGADGGPPEYEVAVVGDPTPAFETTLQVTATASDALVSTTSVDSEEAARTAVEEGRVDAAVLLPDAVIVDQGGGGRLESILTVTLGQLSFVDRLEEAGVDPEQVGELLRPGRSIRVDAIQPPDDDADQIVASLGVILLFVVITLYGQWVLMGVLEEKSNRVVELVVSAVPVRTLLWAKVIGIGALGLLQLLLLAGLGIGAATALDTFTLPSATVPIALWSIVWFILGFGFYAVLYAAAGSLVSRQEDAQTAVMPVALSFVAVYFTTFAVVLPSPESTVSRVVSLLPPFAPVAMPPRIALDAVAPWEVAVAIALMVLGTIAVLRLAARIYTGAVLRTGAKLSMREAWRSARDVSA